MYRTYEFTRTVNGEAKREIAILQGSEYCRFDDVVYEVCLKYYLSQAGDPRRQNSADFNFDEFMTNATPEMFAEYGIELIRPNDNVAQIIPNINIRELKATKKLLIEQRTVAEQILRRLEAKKKDQHPVVSTWDKYLILDKSIVWAHLFLKNGEMNFDKFSNGSCKRRSPIPSTVRPPMPRAQPATLRKNSARNRLPSKSIRTAMVHTPWPPCFM